LTYLTTQEWTFKADYPGMNIVENQVNIFVYQSNNTDNSKYLEILEYEMLEIYLLQNGAQNTIQP